MLIYIMYMVYSELIPEICLTYAYIIFSSRGVKWGRG